MSSKRKKIAAVASSSVGHSSVLPDLCVVDTNVPIVANMRGSDVSPECVLKSIEMLSRFNSDECRLALDSVQHIIREYRHKLNQSGQPGVGDAFLKWVLTNEWNPSRCELVDITPHETRGFTEFPSDASLSGFDPSDRKFVAVTCAHPLHPPILNASDSDWLHANDALSACGVTIIFLCPDDIKHIS